MCLRAIGSLSLAALAFACSEGPDAAGATGVEVSEVVVHPSTDAIREALRTLAAQGLQLPVPTVPASRPLTRDQSAAVRDTLDDNDDVEEFLYCFSCHGPAPRPI